MSALLRRYIRESLRAFFEVQDTDDDGLLVEPDDKPGAHAEENSIGGGGGAIVGHTGPVSAGPSRPKMAPKKKKKRSDSFSNSYGGGYYEDVDES